MAKFAGVTRPAGKRGRPSKAELALRAVAARKTDETPAERVRRIAERFGVMYKLAQGSIAGNVRGLVISGAPGVGKSHTIKHLLEQAKERGDINFRAVSGTITPINLYKLMYQFQKEKDVLLLDDTDSIYDDEESMNLLKAGLDSNERRMISWLSETNALKSEGIETSFEYKGSMIFITNKDLQTAAILDKSRIAVHYRALMDRAVYLDLKLHTADDVMAWIAYMVRAHGILIQRGLSKGQQEDVVLWVQKNYEQIPMLSLRLMNKVADFVNTFPADWESMARITAFADDPRI